MWKSIKLFFKGILKSIYFWISLVCLLYAVYDLFIKQLLPLPYQKDINISAELGVILFAVMIILAGISTYHNLRMKRLDELYIYLPEANKDRIFRIFYELHKQGEFLKNANTERRQRWDEDVLKEMKNYCRIEFEHIYLLNTGRRNYKVTPLEDANYDKALSELKDFLDRDFNQFVKI